MRSPPSPRRPDAGRPLHASVLSICVARRSRSRAARPTRLRRHGRSSGGAADARRPRRSGRTSPKRAPVSRRTASARVRHGSPLPRAAACGGRRHCGRLRRAAATMPAWTPGAGRTHAPGGSARVLRSRRERPGSRGIRRCGRRRQAQRWRFSSLFPRELRIGLGPAPSERAEREVGVEVPAYLRRLQRCRP